MDEPTMRGGPKSPGSEKKNNCCSIRRKKRDRGTNNVRARSRRKGLLACVCVSRRAEKMLLTPFL